MYYKRDGYAIFFETKAYDTNNDDDQRSHDHPPNNNVSIEDIINA